MLMFLHVNMVPDLYFSFIWDLIIIIFDEIWDLNFDACLSILSRSKLYGKILIIYHD